MTFRPAALALFLLFLSGFCCFSAHSQVVINELMVAPSDLIIDNNLYANCGTPNERAREWVEIYNASDCDTVDISCWVLYANTGTSPNNISICSGSGSLPNEQNFGVVILPEGLKLLPRGHYVIGGRTSEGAPDLFIPDLINTSRLCVGRRWYLQNQRGWVGLLNANFEAVDGVYWGLSSDDADVINTNESGANAIFGTRTVADCSCRGRQPRTLPSARDLATDNRMLWAGQYNSNMGSVNATLAQFVRVPDGGEWQADPGFDISPGRCNGPCAETGQLVSFNPKEIFICEGERAQLNARITTGLEVSRMRFNWQSDPAGFRAADDRQSSVEVRPTQTTRYFLKTTLSGCSDLDTITVVVRAIPGTGYTLAPDPLCLGDAVNLTLVSPVIGPAIYGWETTDNRQFAGPGPHRYTPTQVGQISVTLRVDNEGCKSDATIRRFTVINKATADFDAAPLTVCAGQPVRITYRGTGTPQAQFTWSFDGANAVPGTGRGPHDLRWNTEGTRRVRLVVTEGGVCVSEPKEVVIQVERSASSDFILEPKRICLGGFTTATYAGTPVPGATYRWEFGGAQVEGNGQGPGPHRLSWTTPGLRVIRLTVDSPNCPGQTTSQEVQVDEALPFELEVSDSVVCFGSPLRVNYIGEQRTGRVFDWELTDAQVTPLGGPSGPYELRWNSAGDRGIRLRVSDPGSSCPTGERTIMIRVVEPPVASLNVDKRDVCSGETVRLVFTGRHTLAGRKSWNFAGANVDTVSPNPPTYDLRWSTPGTYRVSVSVVEGSCPPASAELEIMVRNQSTATFTLSPNPLCSGQSATVVFEGRITTEAVLNWNFGGATAVPGTGRGPHTLTWPAGTDGNQTVRLNIRDRDSDRCPIAAVPRTLRVISVPRPAFVIEPQGPLCGDDTVTVRYTGGTADSLNYVWNFDGGQAQPATGPGPHRVVWSRSGMGRVSLRLERLGCTSETVSDSIVLLATPDARFSLTDDTLCVNQNALARVTIPPPNGATVKWFLGDLQAFAVDSTASGIDFLPTIAGVYPIRLEINLGQCTGRRAATLTVLEYPQISINAPERICANQVINIRAEGQYADFAQFVWNFGGTQPLSGTDAGPYALRRSAVGLWYLSVTATQGACSTEARDTIEVERSFKAAFRIEPPQACVGDTVRLIPDSSLPAETDLSWRLPAEAALTDTTDLRSPRIRWLRAGNGQPRIQLVTQLGICPPDTATEFARVVSLPVARFSLSPKEICVGDTVVQLFVGRAGPNASFDWGNLAGAQYTPTPGPGHRLRWDSAGVRLLSLTVQDSGCVSLPFVDSVAVKPRPTAKIEVMPKVLCPLAEALVLGFSDRGSRYLWDFASASATPGDETAGPHTLSWATAGTYILRLQTIAEGCSSEVASDSVKVIEPQADFRMDSTACIGSPVLVELTTPFVPEGRYIWDFGNAESATRIGEGRYRVRWGANGTKTVRLQLVLDGCATDTVSRQLVVFWRPIAGFTTEPDSGIAPLRVQFTETSEPAGLDFQWNFGDGTTSNARNPFHLFRKPGTYIVEQRVISPGGCIDSLLDTIYVAPVELHIPNAFTPNGDGRNETFKILNIEGLRSLDMRIFDRWGVLIFESQSPYEAWDGTKDGTPVPEGAYVYRFDIEDELGNHIIYSGTVTVLR